MKLQIRSFLGIEKADLEISYRPVFVVGPNASGKSSLALALGALLARDSNPAGVSSADARAYLHDGEEEGSLQIEGDEGSLELVLPSLAFRQVGTPPAPQRPESVGLVDFTAKRAKKERAEIFEGIFLPPVGPELSAGLSAAFGDTLDAKTRDQVLDYVLGEGFDAALKVFEAQRREQKKQWHDVTTVNYGKDVASKWRPKGLPLDREQVMPAAVEAEIAEAREYLQGLHVEGSITEAQITEAQKAAEKIPGIQNELVSAQRELSDFAMPANDDLEKLRAESKEIGDKVSRAERHRIELARTKVDDEAPFACPDCGKGLILSEGQLQVFDKDAMLNHNSAIDKEMAELDAKGKALQKEKVTIDAQLEEKLSQQRNNEAAYQEKQRKVFELKSVLDIAKKHAAKANETPWTEEDQRKVDEAEERLERLKNELAMIKALREAERIREEIDKRNRICELLGPQGYRSKLTENGREDLNGFLERIAEITDWPCFELRDDYSIVCKYGMHPTRPISLCSASEKWRCQVSMQVAIAGMKGDNYVVIDGADILDDDRQQGLGDLVFRLTETNRPIVSIITMTDTNSKLVREAVMQDRDHYQLKDGEVFVSDDVVPG